MWKKSSTFAAERRLNKMKQQTKDILYKIDRRIRPILNIMSVICLLLLCSAAFDTPVKQILTKLLCFSAGIWLVLVVCRLCLSPFVKSDEEEEFEQKVDYILQQRQAGQTASSNYNPLRELSPEQEEKIKELLQNLPENPMKPGHINLALVAQYLTALQQLGKADLKDKHHLRLWVEEFTGKKVPNSSQFNEAIPSQTVTKVSSARKELEDVL